MGEYRPRAEPRHCRNKLYKLGSELNLGQSWGRVTAVWWW